MGGAECLRQAPSSSDPLPTAIRAEGEGGAGEEGKEGEAASS